MFVREFDFDGRWYHCMKTQRDFGVSLQKTIRVTDLERTVLDNIKDFDKVGGGAGRTATLLRDDYHTG